VSFPEWAAGVLVTLEPSGNDATPAQTDLLDVVVLPAASVTVSRISLAVLLVRSSWEPLALDPPTLVVVLSRTVPLEFSSSVVTDERSPSASETAQSVVTRVQGPVVRVLTANVSIVGALLVSSVSVADAVSEVVLPAPSVTVSSTV
jgi:hypothetical protein